MLKGHLTINKIYHDGTKETLLDKNNLVTVGLGDAFIDVQVGIGSSRIGDYSPTYYQLGTSGMGFEGLSFSNCFFQLSSPLSLSAYGEDTPIEVKNLRRLWYTDGTVNTNFVQNPNDFTTADGTWELFRVTDISPPIGLRFYANTETAQSYVAQEIFPEGKDLQGQTWTFALSAADINAILGSTINIAIGTADLSYKSTSPEGFIGTEYTSIAHTFADRDALPLAVAHTFVNPSKGLAIRLQKTGAAAQDMAFSSCMVSQGVSAPYIAPLETSSYLFCSSVESSAIFLSSTNEFFAEVPQSYTSKYLLDSLETYIYLDSKTANGQAISEIGLFAKNPKGLKGDSPLLMAYKKFDPITKQSDFDLQFIWKIGFLGNATTIDNFYSDA